MEEFMKADIFFFITSIAVVLVTVGIAVALYYIVRILRNIQDVTERVDEGSKMLAEDLSALRGTIKREGFVWGNLFAFLQKYSGLFGKKPRRSPKRETDGEEKAS